MIDLIIHNLPVTVQRRVLARPGILDENAIPLEFQEFMEFMELP